MRVSVISIPGVDMEAYNSHIKIIKYFSCLIGLWPDQSKFTQKIISIFVWLSLISYLIPQLLALKSNWGNVDILITWLPTLFVNLISMSCYAGASLNKNKIRLILSKMKKDWLLCESAFEFKILKENGLLAKHQAKAQIVLIYTAMLEFLTVPLIPFILDTVKPLNESRPRRTIIVTDYLIDVNDNNNYLAIAIHHWHVSIVLITVILTVDGIFIFFVYHACGQLQIIGYKIKNLVKIDYNVSSSDGRNIRKEIKFCVEKHKSVITFVNDISDCYSISYFLGLGLNMIMISFTGVQLVMKSDDPNECLAIFAFNVGQIFRLYCLTVPSQRLIDQSTQLTQNIYDSYWYNLPSESKKLLKIIMLRCIKPTTFTAGKLYCFSMSNFGSVVKTSMSYFTVLLSVRE